MFSLDGKVCVVTGALGLIGRELARALAEAGARVVITDLSTGWLRHVINGPQLHRWHHAIDYVPPGKNFGTKLAIWDTLFGTAELPARKPAGYGLAEPFPAGFLAQQAHAFRRGRCLTCRVPEVDTARIYR